jgi:F-type H+-transporting ATPase subunit epsilon
MFKLSIVTPERIFFEDEVKSLVVPGTEGYLGVLSNHAPIITGLIPGRIEFADGEGKVVLVAVSKGFLEVSNNTATILCDAAERADDIDIERAQKAYDEAKAKLGATGKLRQNIDTQAEKEALERAANRIKVYKETH